MVIIGGEILIVYLLGTSQQGLSLDQALKLCLAPKLVFLIEDQLLLTAKGWRRRQWQPTPVLFPGKSHGWRSLVGCSPWGLEELDMTERLHFHFSLSRTGEGNGNPLQRSCLENPRDGGAWWAAVYGVAQSRTQLKRLGSSSSMQRYNIDLWGLIFTFFSASVSEILVRNRNLNVTQETRI